MAQQPLYRRGRSTRLLLVGLITASLVTITVDYRSGERGPLAAAGRATLSVISPLQRAVSGIMQPVGNFFSSVTNLGSLRTQNEALRLQVAELLGESGSLLSYKRRYEELSTLLQVKQSIPIASRTGRVIALGVSNNEWKITINLGSSDGVQVNDPVVGPEGLIGHVVKAARDVSDVQLIQDPDSHVGVRLSDSRKTGVLKGQGDDELVLELLDPTAEVRPEEALETSGFEVDGTDLGSIYPPNIQVGVVSRVLEDPAALEKHVWVRPNVDHTSLEFVLVVLTPN
jgi:rod shape-determining protein MreC